MDAERLDLYLDGLLPPDEAAAFERELERSPELRAQLAAQAEVDTFLRRRFDEPARPRLAPLPAPAPAVGGPVGGLSRGTWLSAAAAVLVGLGLGFALGGGEAPRPPERRTPFAGDVAHAPAQPAPTGERRLEPVRVPDLDALYRSLTAGTGELGEWGGPGVTLEGRLEARYDECLDVSSPTCALLGPYESNEWPSAAVLVAFCEGVDGPPTLLVVDDQTMPGCGVTPRTGGLLPFYKEVNGLAVWEVTAADQPRLLDSVRSCAE